VLEALDHDDRARCRELGDFIFEGVLLAQVCTESGDFTVADSLTAISDKLVAATRTSSPRTARPAAGRSRPRQTKSSNAGRTLKAREKSSNGDQRTASAASQGAAGAAAHARDRHPGLGGRLRLGARH